MKKQINLLLSLSLITFLHSCNSNKNKAILEINNNHFEFLFGKTSANDILLKLGPGVLLSRIHGVCDTVTYPATLDLKVKYPKLGLTFTLMTHEAVARDKILKQIPVLRMITMDSVGVKFEGLEIGMIKNEIEHLVGLCNIPLGSTDSSNFYRKGKGWHFEAQENTDHQYIVTKIERSYPKTLEELENNTQ